MPRWKWVVLAAGCALGCASTAAAQTPGLSRDENWKRCEGVDVDARLSGCRAIIQSGQEKPADLARAHHNRGVAYRATHLLKLALEDFDEAIKVDPNFIDAYGERGITLTADGRFMDAIPDFSRVLEVEPKSAYAAYNRGMCYELLGLDDLALEDFSSAIALAPNDAFRWERRATLHYRKERFDLALADYEKAIAVDPENAPALYGRGAVKIKKGDLAGGRADITQARIFQPSIDREMIRIGVRP